MAKYYINPHNNNGIYPYDTETNGAPSFKKLLTNIYSILSDGDTIELAQAPTMDIDDSAETVDINNKITIIGNEFTKIKLKSTGIGMNVNVGGCKFIGVKFYTYNSINSSMVIVNSNNVLFDNCTFEAVGSCSMINLNDCDNAEIKNTKFILPTFGAKSYGIYGYNCNYSKIHNNIVDMTHNNGIGILYTGSCSFNTIHSNIIGRFEDNNVGNVGIDFACDVANYNTISHNAIGISGSASKGIRYRANTNSGIDIQIMNNYIVNRGSSMYSTCLQIPYVDTNIVCKYKIINNIFETKSTDCVAINASLLTINNVIDYNDIFGFPTQNMLIHNSVDNIIETVGTKNIYVNPHTKNNSGETDTFTDISYYYCSKNSECVGAGYLNRNIGVGVDFANVISDNYLTLIDTVTNNYGVVNGYDKTINTFFNSVFVDTAQTFNTSYRSGNIVYTTSSVYGNQFEFEYESEFPFSNSNHLYNRDLVYVCTNKNDLRPFSGITCPPNPGYGYNTYTNYETGLWGFLRANKENSCGVDACIIQDVYTNTMQIQNTTYESDIIQNMVNPPCASN